MKFASIFVAGALALAAAPAAAQDYVADQVKKSVVTADLAAVVGSLGHQVIEAGEGDEVLVIAEDANQLKYALIGTACDAGDISGCQGVMMLAQFDLPPGTTYETVQCPICNMSRSTSGSISSRSHWALRAMSWSITG